MGYDPPMGSVDRRKGRLLSLVPELPPLVSVIVPLCDERENLAPLVARLRRTLVAMRVGYEILLVDDGSRDGSDAVLARLAERDADLRVITHRKRRGQSAALARGLAAARGEWVVTLDADLQNPPEEIPRLFEDGLDVDIVHGCRAERHDPGIKRLASRLANAVRNAITGHRVRDSGCALRLMRREALAAIPLFDGAHRFLPTLFAAHGFRGREVTVAHAPRQSGNSKYGLLDRGLRGLIDCFAVRWMLARAIDRSGLDVEHQVAADEREQHVGRPGGEERVEQRLQSQRVEGRERAPVDQHQEQ